MAGSSEDERPPQARGGRRERRHDAAAAQGCQRRGPGLYCAGPAAAGAAAEGRAFIVLDGILIFLVLLAACAIAGLAGLSLAGLWWLRRRRGDTAGAAAAARHLRGALAVLLLSLFGFALLEEAQNHHFWYARSYVRWAEDRWLPLLWIVPAALVWWLAARPWGRS